MIQRNTRANSFWALSKMTGSECVGSATVILSKSLLHLDDIYRDALCLARDREEAAALVMATYERAFESCRAGVEANNVSAPDLLRWLYRNLHAAFCDEIARRARDSRRQSGDSQ